MILFKFIFNESVQLNAISSKKSTQVLKDKSQVDNYLKILASEFKILESKLLTLKIKYLSKKVKTKNLKVLSHHHKNIKNCRGYREGDC